MCEIFVNRASVSGDAGRFAIPSAASGGIGYVSGQRCARLLRRARARFVLAVLLSFVDIDECMNA